MASSTPITHSAVLPPCAPRQMDSSTPSGTSSCHCSAPADISWISFRLGSCWISDRVCDWARNPGISTSAPAASGGSGAPGSVPPPNGCTDFDPRVIATCLDPVSAVAVLPGDGDPIALVAERRTGRILRVRKDHDPVVVATLKVDASTDGGLIGLT